MDLLHAGSAVISEGGVYRYRLDRELFTGGGRVLFVMLNPSTADGTQDDMTIRKCLGFASRWACGHLTVVNLFAYRATDPVELGDAWAVGLDVIGPENDRHIREAASECGLRVVAWSDRNPSRVRALQVYDILRETPWNGRRREVWCLGRTAKGSPRHPSRLAYKTDLEHWNPDAAR